MKRLLNFIVCLAAVAAGISAAAQGSASVYTERPDDPQAAVFDAAALGLRADGKCDVTAALQKTINDLASEQGYGIVFLPEGKYMISSTIYMPPSVRLIGCGKTRPQIVLKPSCEGFAEENYMIWFTGNVVTADRGPSDANAGTFYSAISNIDLRIGKGNPGAVALRTHFAQHGFVSHCEIWAGDGYACLKDVGNEMENVGFHGGRYGIVTSRTSPGWPMMMVDVRFEGHRDAAILTRNAGLTIVNMSIRNTPVGVRMPEGVADRLFIEKSRMENVGVGVEVGVAENAASQLNMIDVACRNVPVAVRFASEARDIEVKDKCYMIRDLTSGLIVDDMAADSEYDTRADIVPAAALPEYADRTVPVLPSVEEWTSVREFGAAGDGETDDTEALRKAAASGKAVYFPTGVYRVTGTVKMSPSSAFIGLHPFATQIFLAESTPAFSGFGAPVAAVESSNGGRDIFNGIGIFTGAYNNRAAGMKWMAGADSYINDVKFIGGHGTLRRPVKGGRQGGFWGRGEMKPSTPTAPVYARGKDLAWDTQYWSLWITDGGGGTVKDVWTADTYAAAGLFAERTSTPTRIMAMSLEHHVRYECRLDGVSNWRIYAMQFEEEGVEGPDCIQMEMNDCHNLRLANTWFYRVIRVSTPRAFGIRTADCSNIDFRNMRNWTQVLYPTELTVYDMNRNLAIYPWDFARATVTGDEPSRRKAAREGEAELLASGFEFATGAVADSKGNVYFCENRLKKIYKWNADAGTFSLLADYPYKPFSLAVDTEDNLLVICRYDPQPGFDDPQRPLRIEQLADNNQWYSGWGNGYWSVLAYAISPEGEMKPLERVKTAEAKGVERYVVPTHRWRDDFDKVAGDMPEYSFAAPDGVTLIPESFDLGRSVMLTAYAPAQTGAVYQCNEDTKTTHRFTVGADGRLKAAGKVLPRGEYAVATDAGGRLYLAEGQIFVYDADGKEVRRINVPERPLSMAVAGDTLFFTTTTSFYKLKL